MRRVVTISTGVRVISIHVRAALTIVKTGAMGA